MARIFFGIQVGVENMYIKEAEIIIYASKELFAVGIQL
jgi:hypothetical protein